jgi:putative transposase
MSRIKRVVAPGVAHHITQRGTRQQRVFDTEKDYSLYLQLLREHADKAGVRIEGYCLMPNHVHLIAVPEQENSLCRALLRVHGDYARIYNISRRIYGHLWQARFYSVPMDRGHYWRAMAYVERNPVRAGLVGQAVDYRWSSANPHETGYDPWGILDMTQWEIPPATQWGIRLAEKEDEGFCCELKTATRLGRPLGDERFLGEQEGMLGRQIRPQRRGPKPMPKEQDEALAAGNW